MIKPATITDNVLRVLEHLGLAESLAITRAEEDRVYAWPVNDELLRTAVLGEWYQDFKMVVEGYHGGRISFREPRGVRPSMQVVFHPADSVGQPWPYFLEMDMDESAPTGVLGKIRHGWEVLRNSTTRRKTDQQRIAELLDRRFQRA